MNTLVTAALAAGFITTAQLKELNTAVMADGVIDREEANSLFELNDKITGNMKNAPGWAPFFAKAITSHVLADENTPGVLDADEAAYLVGKIQGDGQIDSTEKGLVGLILVEATEVHSSFNDLAGTCDPQ